MLRAICWGNPASCVFDVTCGIFLAINESSRGAGAWQSPECELQYLVDLMALCQVAVVSGFSGDKPVVRSLGGRVGQEGASISL